MSDNATIEAGLDLMASKIQEKMDAAGEKGGEFYDGFLDGYKSGLAAAGMTCIEESVASEDQGVKDALLRVNMILIKGFYYAASVQ